MPRRSPRRSPRRASRRSKRHALRGGAPPLLLGLPAPAAPGLSIRSPRGSVMPHTFVPPPAPGGSAPPSSGFVPAAIPAPPAPVAAVTFARLDDDVPMRLGMPPLGLPAPSLPSVLGLPAPAPRLGLPMPDSAKQVALWAPPATSANPVTTSAVRMPAFGPQARSTVPSLASLADPAQSTAIFGPQAPSVVPGRSAVASLASLADPAQSTAVFGPQARSAVPPEPSLASLAKDKLAEGDRGWIASALAVGALAGAAAYGGKKLLDWWRGNPELDAILKAIQTDPSAGAAGVRTYIDAHAPNAMCNILAYVKDEALARRMLIESGIMSAREFERHKEACKASGGKAHGARSPAKAKTPAPVKAKTPAPVKAKTPAPFLWANLPPPPTYVIPSAPAALPPPFAPSYANPALAPTASAFSAHYVNPALAALDVEAPAPAGTRRPLLGLPPAPTKASRAPAPARKASPPRRATAPARKASPPRRSAPAHKASPPRRSAPARKASPPRRSAPARKAPAPARKAVSPPRLGLGLGVRRR